MVHCLRAPSPRCIADPVLPCGAQVAEELAYVRDSRTLRDLDGSLLARVMERARLRAEEHSSHGGEVSRDSVIFKATHMSGGIVLVEVRIESGQIVQSYPSTTYTWLASSFVEYSCTICNIQLYTPAYTPTARQASSGLVGAEASNVSTLVQLRCLKAPCCVRSRTARGAQPHRAPPPRWTVHYCSCTVSMPCVPQVRSMCILPASGAQAPAALRTVAATLRGMCAHWANITYGYVRHEKGMYKHVAKGCLFEQRLNVSRVARVFAWHARPHIVHSHAVHLP